MSGIEARFHSEVWNDRISSRQRIYDLLSHANSDDRNFPATIFYNEGWLFRLVLDWFFTQSAADHALSVAPGAKWFSEAYPLGKVRPVADLACIFHLDLIHPVIF